MALSEKAKQAKREYMQRWREANPEKVKQHQKNYWERKAREQKEGARSS